MARGKRRFGTHFQKELVHIFNDRQPSLLAQSVKSVGESHEDATICRIGSRTEGQIPKAGTLGYFGKLLRKKHGVPVCSKDRCVG